MKWFVFYTVDLPFSSVILLVWHVELVLSIYIRKEFSRWLFRHLKNALSVILIKVNYGRQNLNCLLGTWDQL